MTTLLQIQLLAYLPLHRDAPQIRSHLCTLLYRLRQALPERQPLADIVG